MCCASVSLIDWFAVLHMWCCWCGAVLHLTDASDVRKKTKTKIKNEWHWQTPESIISFPGILLCVLLCVCGFFFFNIPSTLRRKSKTHVRAHTHAHTFSSFLPIPETRIKQKTRGLHGWTCRLGWPSGEALVRLVITETDLGSIPLWLSTVFKSYGLLALSLLEILFLTINQTLKMALIAAHTHAEVILVSGDSTALGIVSLPSPHPTPTHTHWSGDLGPRQYLFSRRQLVGTQV